MRQIVGQTGKVALARMPRPVVEANSVLVRVQYSFVSAGTETASLGGVQTGGDAVEALDAYAARAWRYLGKAVRDPRKAARRLSTIAHHQIERLKRQETMAEPADAVDLPAPAWTRQAAVSFEPGADGLAFTSDDSAALYQVTSAPVTVPAGHGLSIALKGRVSGSSIALGLLDGAQTGWLGNLVLQPGEIDDDFTFDLGGESAAVIVFSNTGTGRPCSVDLESAVLRSIPPERDGAPASDLGGVGWHMGYSVAGEVVAVGDACTEFAPGDVVACGGAGKANHADFVSVPKNLVCRVPVGCSIQAASSVSIGAIAMQGVRRAETGIGDVVCVIGLGLIGLITAQILKASGCRVVGYDLSEERVARAAALGLGDTTADAGALHRHIAAASQGQGADVTVVTAASRSAEPVNLAMQTTRRKGRVVLVGDVALDIERPVFYQKEIDLLMSTSYGPGRYDANYERHGRDYPYAYVRWTQNRNMQSYLRLIADEAIDIDGLIDWIVPAAEAEDAFRRLLNPGDGPGPLGMVIYYGDRKAAQAATRIELRGHARIRGDRVKYALVGAGGFAAGTLVPTLDRLGAHFQLYAVVSRDPVRGGAIARQHRTPVLATDLGELLDDEALDLAVIATRHDEHADAVLRCLEAGKDVFVEKPLCTSWEQLDRIASTYEALEAPPLLTVGFNRRFSPAIAALRKELENRAGPVVMNYRMNGGFIPLDNWVQTEEGAGRNIGEACHIYDTFRMLAGAPVAAVSARSIDPQGRNLLRNDNFAVTVTYEDGSMGLLCYTALGPKQGLPKERLELFCDGEAYVLDDYRSLTRASDGAVLWSAPETDKGHFLELQALGKALTAGGQAPIPYAELIETSALALHVEDLLRSGGGEVRPEAED